MQASPAYWLRRADQFDAARPRPGEFTGHATPEELADADERCAEAARLCRFHASIVADPALWEAELEAYLDHVDGDQLGQVA